jgi:hypothetical protein
LHILFFYFLFLSGLCVSTEAAIFFISLFVNFPGVRKPFDAILPIRVEVFSFLAIDSLSCSPLHSIGGRVLPDNLDSEIPELSQIKLFEKN